MSSLISPKICSSAAPVLTCKKTRFSQSLQIRAQISRDHEGRSSNMVDANLHLLKVRVEEVRNKERLAIERCCQADEQGWNYHKYYSYKTSKRNTTIHQQQILLEIVELVRVIASTFGITLFGCSLCLCLVSLLLHFNH